MGQGFRNTAVAESGKAKTFISMTDWPGWSRSGKTESEAITTLTAYADRYRQVIELAGLHDLPTDVEIVDRLPGNGQTDFGVPGRVHDLDYQPIDADEAARLVEILKACWLQFDDMRGRVSAELRKGPRGGGRDRDAIVEHVVEADRGYARGLGVKTPSFDTLSTKARQEHSQAVYDALMERRDGQTTGKAWPMHYTVRRMAWHILDHTWEMEDKNLSQSILVKVDQ